MLKIPVIHKSKHALPEYSTPHSAGLDLRADLDSPVVLGPLERAMIPT
jgi:dUTP pyrophosphatase